MKIPVEWLKEFVETDASPAEIGDELTMLGLELEAAEESALGPVLDFKVTPNRGDCLSVFGLARELAAKDSQRYRPTEHFRRAAAGFPAAPPNDSESSPNDPALVAIEATELCGRYVGAVIRGVKVGTSPPKIAARLQACGMRPIDSVVDTTNYVMLELGQPLHAFDLRQLKGGRIVVRRARSGEAMKTLDGQQRVLTPEMLMICDAERPVAIAGVMGGENSEVAADTTELLLESAHFDPVSIRRTRRSLGMSTEASYRFERFVDPGLCLAAARRVCDLLGTSSEVCDVYPGKAERASILVREARWNALLGTEVPTAAAASILVALGCVVSEREGGLSVVPPSWRNDLQIEEDLVEEIGRMWGYEKIPEALPFGSPMGGYGAEAAFRKRLKAAMLRLGLVETLTHTLGASCPLSVGEAVEVRNPAAPELSQLRTSLLPGIAGAAAKNRGRSLALFEIGRVFVDGTERRSLGILWSGSVGPAHWDAGKPAAVDFFALKGALESLGALVGRQLTFRPSDDARFRAGRRAAIMAGERSLGVMGEISPAIAESTDLGRETFAAEIDVDALVGVAENKVEYCRLSPYPAVRRDFAFVIDKSVQYAAIERVVREAAAGVAEDIRLFDVYAGKGIAADKHSLGLALTLRHPEKTLTDEEANEISERAFAEIRRLGGVPRA